MGAYLELASRGRNGWWRYLLCPLVAVLLACLTLLALGIGLTLMGLLPPNIAADIQRPGHVIPFFLGIATSFAALTAGLILAAWLIHRKRPGDLIGQWRWDFLAWGLGMWAAVQGIATLIDVMIVPHGFAVSANRGSASFAAIALVGISIQTFAEEFIFRGYVTQGLLLTLKKPLPTALASGVLFGAVHAANGIPQALNAVAVGVVFALIAMRTGGIAMTWGLHLANNYWGAAVVVSADDVFRGAPGLFVQKTPQLIWWDLCVGVAALGAVLWLLFRRPYFAAAPAT